MIRKKISPRCKNNPSLKSISSLLKSWSPRKIAGTEMITKTITTHQLLHSKFENCFWVEILYLENTKTVLERGAIIPWGAISKQDLKWIFATWLRQTHTQRARKVSRYQSRITLSGLLRQCVILPRRVLLGADRNKWIDSYHLSIYGSSRPQQNRKRVCCHPRLSSGGCRDIENE